MRKQNSFSFRNLLATLSILPVLGSLWPVTLSAQTLRLSPQLFTVYPYVQSEDLRDLMAFTGTNNAQMLTALKQAGYDIDSVAELNQNTQEEEFPPDPFNVQAARFLYYLDGNFRAKIDSLHKLIGSSVDNKTKQDLTQAANLRLIDLMEKLYDHDARELRTYQRLIFQGGIETPFYIYVWNLGTRGGIYSVKVIPNYDWGG